MYNLGVSSMVVVLLCFEKETYFAGGDIYYFLFCHLLSFKSCPLTLVLSKDPQKALSNCVEVLKIVTS